MNGKAIPAEGRLHLGSRCVVCGAGALERRDYLRFENGTLGRTLAYSLPAPLLLALGRAVPRFDRAAKAVLTNRKYFSVNSVWCGGCSTGFTDPLFQEERLSQYYEEYYWDNRDLADGQHLARDGHPSDTQLRLSTDRLDWIAKKGADFRRVIDFGAGDCAAGYLLRSHSDVIVVDPSTRSARLAGEYGLPHRPDLALCSPADLLYSSHSIEHVHDLRGVFAAMVESVRPGGYLFFETPNIANRELFRSLFRPPHTYTLSSDTFETLARDHDLSLVASETVGPPWRANHRGIASDDRADLRVLLRRS